MSKFSTTQFAGWVFFTTLGYLVGMLYGEPIHGAVFGLCFVSGVTFFVNKPGT